MCVSVCAKDLVPGMDALWVYAAAKQIKLQKVESVKAVSQVEAPEGRVALGLSGSQDPRSILVALSAESSAFVAVGDSFAKPANSRLDALLASYGVHIECTTGMIFELAASCSEEDPERKDKEHLGASAFNGVIYSELRRSSSDSCLVRQASGLQFEDLAGLAHEDVAVLAYEEQAESFDRSSDSFISFDGTVSELSRRPMGNCQSDWSESEEDSVCSCDESHQVMIGGTDRYGVLTCSKSGVWSRVNMEDQVGKGGEIECDMIRFSDFMQIPVKENGEPTSYGSVGHYHFNEPCKVCVFTWPGRTCEVGRCCKFCHGDHRKYKRVKRNRKGKVK
eukprot:gnl/TRDRNA2_/TRDRNA2_174369_c2_seq5.p1 gnl/TRDRNA2_/TRDRNA2_174369_c2~~gnl/TRDRNA2_/TRDRNA2_174369_c2_seq5.p1  ORF type:complete len:335 (+),score=41.76 gnl/TRDRNA2_/TRDRNA2_174369_c2_seq5:439-1443(+)